MPEAGKLVYIDGNQAAIVIGEAEDGSVIVGTFAGAQTVEKGHYGDVPSEAGLPPSTQVEGAAPGIAVAAPPVSASAGGLETAEPITTQADDGTPVSGSFIDASIGTQFDVDDEAAEAAELAAKDARIAELEAQVASQTQG